MEKDITNILEKIEKERLLSNFQRIEEGKGNIPTDPFFIQRSMPILELIGGAIVGSMTALISIYIVFFLYVWIFHFNFQF